MPGRRTEIVENTSIVEGFAGRHMAEPAVIAAIEAADWAGIYPVVDRAGFLTGAIVSADSPEANDYTVVDWVNGQLATEWASTAMTLTAEIPLLAE